tara:strand:+ start:32 stop:796 length:765 start_codon:yes stop_codon:yes gene_type:complete
MSSTKDWSNKVINNFEQASKIYNDNAIIQREFAKRLAKVCSKQSISKGLWTDLGSGTGLLADALEQLHPDQHVLRVDGSEGMLSQQEIKNDFQLWDLNLGLPTWDEPPSLIASSFALHWLSSPAERLEEWIKALPPSGWLALAVPIKGSFPEWHLAAECAEVRCTAMPLPSGDLLIEVLNQAKSCCYQKVQTISQEHDNPFSLLKAIKAVGAQATTEKKLTRGEMRNLIKSWPRTQGTNSARLTWHIQLALIQK